jgi:hypothetical protein
VDATPYQDHEWNGIGELAKSFGIVTTGGKEIGSGKQKELVQLLACKQEIGGKRIWGDNSLLTKTYSCLESAARAFRALCHRLAAALRAVLLRLAASIPPPDAAGAAAPIAPAPAPAAPAMGSPAREETTAELGEKYLASMKLRGCRARRGVSQARGEAAVGCEGAHQERADAEARVHECRRRGRGATARPRGDSEAAPPRGDGEAAGRRRVRAAAGRRQGRGAMARPRGDG